MTREDRIRRLAVAMERWEEEHADAKGITPGRLWWLAERVLDYVDAGRDQGPTRPAA